MTRVPRSAVSSTPDVQLRDALEAQRAELVAHEGHRPLQRLQRRARARPSADDVTQTVAWRRSGVVSTSVIGHEADARVLDVAREDGADLLAQEMVDAVGALAHGVHPAATG